MSFPSTPSREVDCWHTSLPLFCCYWLLIQARKRFRFLSVYPEFHRFHFNIKVNGRSMVALPHKRRVQCRNYFVISMPNGFYPKLCCLKTRRIAIKSIETLSKKSYSNEITFHLENQQISKRDSYYTLRTPWSWQKYYGAVAIRPRRWECRFVLDRVELFPRRNKMPSGLTRWRVPRFH